jgi:hypothetical protein
MFVGPQTQGSTTQMSGTAPSLAQSESEAQGCVTIGQAPPQTLCPSVVQVDPD